MDAVCYTIDEVAQRWRVSANTVYALLRSGRLKGFKAGGQWRITPEALTEYETAPNETTYGTVRVRRRKNQGGSVLRIV